MDGVLPLMKALVVKIKREYMDVLHGHAWVRCVYFGRIHRLIRSRVFSKAI
jgi:hypothetical protein